eukprot:gene20944-23780_t
MESTGMTGETEPFSYPLFQTFGMFLGMTGGLLLHILVIKYKIPFPGYTHSSANGYSAVGNGDEESASITNKKAETKPLPTHMYFLLIVPAIFDLIATSLATYGLRYVTVSVYQMLRGSAIVFVAILKQFVLKDLLTRYQWVGIAINCVSIVLVGFTAMMIEASTQAANETSGDSSGEGEEVLGLGGGTAIIGVVLILLGALVQSVQYVFEEKVMSADDNDPDVAPTPPLLLIGMEGLWGLLICVGIMYPVAYYYPGEDHGSFENPFNTWVMLSNSLSVQLMFAVYFAAILMYNILACLVTYELDSVWHAILDNFRPATVWGADLLIFYCVTAAFGEPWNQPWSLLQLLGMFVLLYGTAIYNAPNPGPIKLTGGAASCFIDCSDEYEQHLPVVYVSSSSDVPSPPSSSSSSASTVVCAANHSPYYDTLQRHRTAASRWGGIRRRVQIDAAQRREADAGGESLGVQRHGDKLFYVVLKAAQKAAEKADASNPTEEISPYHKNRSYVVSPAKGGSIALNKTNYGAAGAPPAR